MLKPSNTTRRIVGASLAAACVLSSAVSASAQDRNRNEDPVALWGGLYSGMAKSEVKALYPKYRAEFFPDCPVKVLTNYKKKKLISVILIGTDKGGNCTERVVAAHQAEHGVIEGDLEVQATNIGIIGVTGTLERRDFNLQLDGKRVTVAVMPTRPTTFNIIHTVRTDGKLY